MTWQTERLLWLVLAAIAIVASIACIVRLITSERQIRALRRGVRDAGEPKFTSCNDLDPFVDGELGRFRAWMFRRHLRRCTDCQRELVDAIALRVRLADLPRSAR